MTKGAMGMFLEYFTVDMTLLFQNFYVHLQKNKVVIYMKTNQYDKKHKNKTPKQKTQSSVKKIPVKQIEKIPPANKYKNYVLAGVLLLTVCLYRDSLQNDFVKGDDYNIVVNNADIRSFANVPKFFTQPYHFMYCPVKMISHTIDYAFSGENPAGYHFFSILYHVINVALVYILVYLLLSNVWGAVIAALLFAIHPINVETVCWLTGRGDLLYGGFYFGGLIAYIYYLTKGFRSKYIVITFGLFVLSGLSKASAFTFPLALVALDWYYRRKLFSRHIILEKIPFFLGALALGLSSIVLRADHIVSMESYFSHYSGIDHFVILIYPLTFYLAKFFVPFKLAFPYPHPFTSELPLSWDYYLYPFIIVILAVLIWRCTTIRRPLLFAVLFYFAMIVSALRLTPMVGTIAADRYFYVAMVAVVFFIGWAFVYLSEHKHLWNKRACTTFLVVFAGFAITMTVMTYERIKVFKNAITLFGDAHEKYPYHATPLQELMGGYLFIGDIAGAIKTSEKITTILTQNPEPLATQFNLMVSAGRYTDALQSINRLVVLAPTVESYWNKAHVHQLLNQPDSTIATLNIITEVLQPDRAVYIAVMNMKAEIYNNQQLFVEAVATADTLLACYPDTYSILMNRSEALLSMGNTDAALTDLNTLVKYEPTNMLAWLNAGKIYFQVGRLSDACQYWEKAKSYGSTEAVEWLKNCR